MNNKVFLDEGTYVVTLGNYFLAQEREPYTEDSMNKTFQITSFWDEANRFDNWEDAKKLSDSLQGAKIMAVKFVNATDKPLNN